MSCKILKVALINPPQLLPKSWGKPTVWQNLGLMYIASVLQKEGHEVKVIDAVAIDWEEPVEMGQFYYSGMRIPDILKELRRFGSEIVGISSPFTVNSKVVDQLAYQSKTALPDAKVVLGGADITARANEYKDFDSADFIAIGEGENVVKEITLSQEKMLKKDFIQNLDEIPFPSRELFPMEEYFKAYDKGRACRHNYLFHRRWTNIVCTRGCPYNCVFCSIHLSMGRKFRKRSVKNIETEINELVNGKLKIKHINFEDDNISLERDFFIKLLHMMIRNDYDITWSLPNGIRADTLNEEIVKKMAEVGCKRVFVAPESGVQRVVNEVIHKNLDLTTVERAVKLFKKHRIIVDVAFVIGLVGETKKDILDSIRYAEKLKKLGAEEAGFGIATPLYGTELHSQAVSKSYIPRNLDCSKLSPFESVISTEEWDSEWMLKIRDFASWYVSKPLWRKLLSIGKMLLSDTDKALDFIQFWWS